MTHRIWIAGVLLSVGLMGCQGNSDHDHHTATTVAGAGDRKIEKAKAMIEPTKGNTAKGTIELTQMGDKVKVVAHINGLKPNQKHAIHVHEGMECGEDGMKALGHYNPEKHGHGLPDKAKRHAGDWGNLSADADGHAMLELTVDNISINGAKNPVLGRAIIVHEKADDGGQPTGNAGARIGCGLIKEIK